MQAEIPGESWGWDAESEMAELGARLRLVKGRLTIVAMADILGVNHESLRRYLRGRAVPAFVLMRMVTRMGVDASWLLTGKAKDPASMIHTAPSHVLAKALYLQLARPEGLSTSLAEVQSADM